MGSSSILTKLFTSINAKQVNNKTIPNTRKMRCRNSSMCSEKGNSNVIIEFFVKLKLELVTMLKICLYYSSNFFGYKILRIAKLLQFLKFS